MSATLLFLPRDSHDPWRWLRVEADAIVAQGEGLPPADAAAPVTAVAPADAVALHWAELPDRSTAQSIAAARILVTEAVAGPAGDLHVAVGREAGAGGGGDRPIGVVAGERMRDWLAALAGIGVDPAAIVPAPMLLPRPAEGFTFASLAGGGVVRGTSTGFADEPELTGLVTAGAPLARLEGAALESAIAAAVAAPSLNLRQGPFARRRRRTIDWPLVRRLAMLAALTLATTLLIDLVRIARYRIDATALEARADALARTGLPRGAQDGDPARLLDDRLSRLRGPGLGFSRTAAIAFAAVRDAGGSEVSRLAFEPNGDLRIGLVADGEAQANAVKRAIEASGMMVEASAFEASGSRLSGEMTVRAP